MQKHIKTSLLGDLNEGRVQEMKGECRTFVMKRSKKRSFFLMLD